MIQIVIVRDARESPKKCSLTPLRGVAGIEFRAWVRDRPIDVSGCTLLHPEGAPLTRADAARPLLLVDSSWRRLPQLLRDLRGDPVRRSIPGGYVTAYPRKSNLFEDPAAGLASVEALYVATVVLGEPRPELLDGYRWKTQFLAQESRTQ